MQVIQMVGKQEILDKLRELEAMLELTTSDGEGFKENIQSYDDWAAEVDRTLRTLIDTVDYYID